MSGEPPFTVVSATAPDGSDSTERAAKGIALMLEGMRLKAIGDEFAAYVHKDSLSLVDQIGLIKLTSELLSKAVASHLKDSERFLGG